MKHKKITISNKDIHIIDDLFDFSEKTFFEEFCIDTQFHYMSNNVSPTTRHLPSSYLHCRLTNEEVNEFGLNNKPKIKSILSNVLGNNYYCSDTWINLTLPGFVYYKHVDFNKSTNINYTLLYYCTTTWCDHFGGETFFYNDFDEKEVVVDYLPGRIILFNSKIAHKPAYSFGHVVGRYVYVSCFHRDEEQKHNVSFY